MLLFLHWVGFSVWLGAQLTFMVWGPQSRAASLDAWAHAWRTLAKVQGYIIAPAAAVATITGLVLTMRMVSSHADETTPLLLMQVFGVAAGVLAIAAVMPLTNRVAMYAQLSLSAGQKDPRAERARGLLAWAGAATIVLVLLALWFGARTPAVSL